MIKLDHVCVHFPKASGRFIFKKTYQQILYDVSFDVKEGECLGILGESGSGKSTLGRVICSLLQPFKGSISIDSVELYTKRETLEPGTLAVVFQDYTTSVNPRFTVRDIINESFIVLFRRTGKRIDVEQEAVRLLKLVGLDEEFLYRYPHQLSGGQLQRVCIARAIAVQPKVILFDEAISSLDAHTQVQVMDLLKDIKKQYNFTYIFITHDLPSVAYLCDRVLFLYKGRVEEVIPVEDMSHVTSDYAKSLLHSILDINM